MSDPGNTFAQGLLAGLLISISAAVLVWGMSRPLPPRPEPAPAAVQPVVSSSAVRTELRWDAETDWGGPRDQEFRIEFEAWDPTRCDR